MELDFQTKHSCLMTYSWDWKTSLSQPKELHRLRRMYVPENVDDPYDYGQDIIQSKDRVRGRGTALSITLTAPEGKYAKINGLAVLYTG